MRSGKTIYVRFDLKDYSIPHSHVSRTHTLVASATQIRLLDVNGVTEIARHVRSYDRHQRVDDPAHFAALLEQKRKFAHIGRVSLAFHTHNLPNLEVNNRL